MKNQLLEPVDYKVEHTGLGTWRRFMYPNGQIYAEFISHSDLLGLPLLHYTKGICPESGRRKTAKGVVAVGRRALGILAVGQAAAGLVAIGQASLGLLFGLGQATAGLYALGQLALGWEIGIGQVATGALAVGQIAIGKWVLAQIGLGTHVWDQRAVDPAAAEHFRMVWEGIRAWFTG
jgi:hypothetical protein